MKSILVLLIPALFAFSVPTQYSYSVRSIPAELLPNAGAVVRLDLTTLQVKSVGEATLERRVAVTYLYKPDESALTLELSDGGLTKVRAMHVAVYDGEGRLLRETDRSEVQDYGSSHDYEFTDSRLRVLSVAPLEPPFTVEFSYKIDYRDFFTIPQWTVQTLGCATEYAEFTLRCPADYRFQWKGFRTGLQPIKTENGAWRWVARRLPAVPYEPNNLCFKGRYAYLLFAPDQFKVGDTYGSMRNWADFGRFMYELNAGRDAISPELAARVRAMTAGCGSEAEKIAVLYRFLQENTRYVSVQLGIGGWQTFPAEYVEKNGYGDCKALSNYMRALLKAAGIESWQALVYADAGSAPEPTGDFAYSAFNHVILYVPSTDTWLECTSNQKPAGYLGRSTSDRQALLLTPGGGRLLRTPSLDAVANTSYSRATLALSENGAASVTYREVIRGGGHDWYRELATERNAEERQRIFISETDFSIVRLDRLEITAAATRPEAVVDYALEIPNYATRTGRRLFVPITKLDPIHRNLPRDTARVLDLVLRRAFSTSDTVNILLPDNYVIENTPAEVNVSSEFGTYRMTVVAEPGKNEVMAIRQVTILPVQVSGERYEAVRQFYQQVAQAESGQLILVKRP